MSHQDLFEQLATYEELKRENVRPCPECELLTIKGMPGGADSTCKNCGYKDPCCYD